MIYADVDFILALAKKEDWLKKQALEIYNKYEKEIVISSITLIELMLIAKKIDYDPKKLILFALSLGDLIGDDPKDYLQACEHQKKYGLGVFDSLHIVNSSKTNNRIISSDKKFKKIPFLEIVNLGRID